MDVGSAFAEYFERESRGRNDGREPSILPAIPPALTFSFPLFLDLSSLFLPLFLRLSSPPYFTLISYPYLCAAISISLPFCFRFFDGLPRPGSFPAPYFHPFFVLLAAFVPSCPPCTLLCVFPFHPDVGQASICANTRAYSNVCVR